MGDGGSGGDPENRAQNLKSRLGKLLRINPTRAGSAWQIVGFGLRNPWRFSFDRQTGDLWIGDVGQDTWEEVDYRAAARIGKLANYGWSRYEGTRRLRPQQAVHPQGRRRLPAVGVLALRRLLDHRRVRLPRLERSGRRGALLLRRLLQRHRVELHGRQGPRVRPLALGKIANLSSFGEDANGELYAVSTDGTCRSPSRLLVPVTEVTHVPVGPFRCLAAGAPVACTPVWLATGRQT